MDTPIATNSLVLGRILSRQARYRPDHLAVVFEDERLTYAEFNAQVNRWANALSGLGVARGDRVATLLPNCLEGLATYWACAKLGAAAVPLSSLLLEEGLVSLLSDARPRVIVSTASFARLLSKVRPRLAVTPPPAIVLVDGEAPDMPAYARLVAATSAAERPSPSFA